MNCKQQIIHAIQDKKEGDDLLDLARNFKRNGMGKDEMYNLFDSLRDSYADDKNEIILDAMDYIVGWCDRDKKIF